MESENSKMKTEQELWELFNEKYANQKYTLAGRKRDFYKIFKDSYSLAYEAIKQKDELLLFYFKENSELKEAIADARYLIFKIPNWEGIPLPYKEKAQAWLKENGG